jgi:hypothetical protein
MCRESSTAFHRKRWVALNSMVWSTEIVGICYRLIVEFAPDPNRKSIKHFFELLWEELKTGHKPEPKNKK